MTISVLPKIDELSTPPQPHELEISIFGPGRGECIVIHLGDNEWCVVDSCVGRGRSEPVAIEYLKSLNTSAVANVSLVIATHWHDDHIKGLAAILDLAPLAKFCCSMAVKHDEFLALVSALPENISGCSGVEEFAAILQRLKSRGQQAPIFAVENKTILKLTTAGRSFPLTLITLSPSDPTIKLALEEIAKLAPKAGEPQRRVINPARNRASVVLSIEAGAMRVLLGADLEHTGHPGEGWIAVIKLHKPTVPAHIFKVPHHGSVGADHPDVWQKLLAPNPISVVTPYTSARLPKGSDLARLMGRTTKLYCTAEFPGKPPRRDNSTERDLKAKLPNRRVLDGQPGHVRIRWSAAQGSEPYVRVFRGAYRVTQS